MYGPVGGNPMTWGPSEWNSPNYTNDLENFISNNNIGNGSIGGNPMTWGPSEWNSPNYTNDLENYISNNNFGGGYGQSNY